MGWTNPRVVIIKRKLALMTKSVMLPVIELLLLLSWYPNCTVSTLVVLFVKLLKNFPKIIIIIMIISKKNIFYTKNWGIFLGNILASTWNNTSSRLVDYWSHMC